MERDTVDLRLVMRLFVRRWWILLLGLAAGGIVANLIPRPAPAPATYASTAKVFVQAGAGGVGPTRSTIAESQGIAELYRDLATTRPIFEEISRDERVPYTARELAGRMQVVNARSFLEVRATDTDPELAATVANVAAEVVIRALTERQFAQVAEFQDSLERYGLDRTDPAVAAQAPALPILSIAEEALPSSSPVSGGSPVGRPQMTVAGAALGLLIAGIAIGIGAMLDDSIRSETELSSVTGLPGFGSVPKYGAANGAGPILLDTEDRGDPAAEAYMFIRARLESAVPPDEPIRTLMVTSPGPAEGKSSTASNIAVSYTREGKSVILVDADLRRPVLHTLFGLGDHSTHGVMRLLAGDETVDEALLGTSIRGLRVLTAGPLPPDPSPILRTPGFKGLIASVSECADVVILDCPPLLAVSDALLLAHEMDAAILVGEAGGTKRGAARAAAAAIAEAGPRCAGVVLTKVPTSRGGEYGYYYHHYYTAYSGRRSNGKNGGGPLSGSRAGSAVSSAASKSRHAVTRLVDRVARRNDRKGTAD